MDLKQPIVILDSGFGGLSVYNLLKKVYPYEQYFYFADHVYYPYGEKEPFLLKERLHELLEMFLQYQAKAIVLACHTASISLMQQPDFSFPIPIYSLYESTKTCFSKHTFPLPLCILGTKFTIQSREYQKLLSPHKAIPLIGSKLVEVVEKGASKQEVQQAIKETFDRCPSFRTLFLGCTHFSSLKKILSTFFPSPIMIEDGLDFFVQQIGKDLTQRNLLRKNNEKQKDIFVSSTEEFLHKADGKQPHK